MPTQTATGQRIAILDSFRFVAILMVACYHYFFRFYTIYPYGAKYRHVVFFEYGYMGVELFFMISGFVILMTLERSKHLCHFLAKRFIRLFPAMVICSIITYFTFLLLDRENRLPSLHSQLSSFLPSWTFTEPYLWTVLLHRKFNYVDGAYWSLAVEVKFYIAAGLMFFASKKHFFRNWTILVAIAVAIRLLVQEGVMTGTLQRVLEIILFPKFIILFTIGMFFFKLYNNEPIARSTLIAVVAMVVCQLFLIRLVNNTWIEKTYLLVFIALFVLFQYRRKWLAFLDISVLQKCGQASYALYLLHEYIGLFLILNFALLTGWDSFLVPVVVFIFLSLVSLFVYYRIEGPVARTFIFHFSPFTFH